jgi:hypothetical protein
VATVVVGQQLGTPGRVLKCIQARPSLAV